MEKNQSGLLLRDIKVLLKKHDFYTTCTHTKKGNMRNASQVT